MDVTFAHLCDYATVSREGKLSVLGIFQNINAPQLPYQLPMAYLAFELEMVVAELGRPSAVEIRCLDQDGHELFKMQGQVAIEAGPGHQPRLGDRPRLHQVIAVAGLEFTRSGAYEIVIFVNGALKKSIPFKVIQLGVEGEGKGRGR